MFKLPPSPVGVPPGHSFWNDWYEKIRTIVNSPVVANWTDIDFTSSNLTSITTRNHNDLQNFQGGTAGQYYHTTAAQNAAIVAGITVVVTTAKLTGGGANGSMTFTNGILTAQTQAT